MPPIIDSIQDLWI